MIFIKDQEGFLFLLKNNKTVYVKDTIEINSQILLNKNKIIGIGNNAKIKFKNCFGLLFNGFVLKDKNIIQNISIESAELNGIKIIGNKNKIENVSITNCKNTGLQITTNASKNKIINCVSSYNFSGENKADGFGCKFDSGKGNVFINCLAYCNEDDGFDLFEAGRGVELKNCCSINNGIGVNSTGSGFKLGGFKNLNEIKKPFHKIYNCFAIDNKNYGFSANNQLGKILLKNCIAYKNKKEDLFFPKYSHPKALDNNELKLGKFYLYNCFGINNNILGVLNDCRL